MIREVTKEEVDEAEAEYLSAKRKLYVLRRRYALKGCQHSRVLEAPYRYSEWFISSGPVRICLDCGHEEQLPAHDRFPYRLAAHTPTGYRTVAATLLNTEFVKAVTRDEIWAARKPLGSRRDFTDLRDKRYKVRTGRSIYE